MALIKALKNEKGQNLVAVMVAAGLVVLAGLAVSSFLTNHNNQAQKLESSSQCQRLAKDVVNYVLKDQATLVVYSNGPDSTGATQGDFTAATPGTTEDGVSMYGFMGTPIPAYQNLTATPYMNTATNSATPIASGTWNFYNFLNAQNSLNRLLTLANAKNMCCAANQINLNNCGATYYDSANPPAGGNPPRLNLMEGGTNAGKVQVKLGINITDNGNTLCSGANLKAWPNGMPNTHDTIAAKFVVGVTTDAGTPSSHYCELEGSAQLQPGSASPYTLLRINTPQATLCGSKYGNPSICSAGQSVQLEMKTFVDSNAATQSCKSFISSTPMESICGSTSAGGPRDLFALATAAPASCTPSFPGSLFLCRIGEQNWFMANPNHWEPCDKTKVYECTGAGGTYCAGTQPIPGVTVSVAYQPAGNGKSDHSTDAILTINNPPTKAYMVDVRAVDVLGRQLGPSYCSLAETCSQNICSGGANNGFGCSVAADCPGGACVANSNIMPTFVVDTSPPVFTGKPTSNGGYVDTAAKGPTGNYGAIPAGAGTAFSIPAHSMYQCSGGNSLFVATGLNYPGLQSYEAGLGLGGKCTGTINGPGGYSATASPGPSLALDSCSVYAGAPTGGANGNYTVTISYINDCNLSGGGTTSDPWCFDTTTNFSVLTQEVSASVSQPTFSMSYPATKACGLVYANPTITSPVSNYSYFSAAVVSMNWQTSDWKTAANSGCLAYPMFPNLCTAIYDPCGRPTESLADYSTLLPDVLTPANNLCEVMGALNVGGNSCLSAADHCSSTYNCTSAYSPVGPHLAPCWTNADCVDPVNDCPGQDGTCGTTFTCDLGGGNTGSPVFPDPCPSGGPGTACQVNNGVCIGHCSATTTQTCVNNGGCPGSETCTNTGGFCNVTSISCSVAPGAACPNSSGTCAIVGAGSTCQAPTNSTCSPCSLPGPHSGNTYFCPDINSCTPAIFTPSSSPASCASPAPPASVCATTTSTTTCTPNTPCSNLIIGPQPGTQTTTTSCVPNNPPGCTCPSGLPPPTVQACTYNCPACKWHRGQASGDQVFIGPHGSPSGLCATAPSGAGGIVCAPMPGVGNPCNCGASLSCLDNPNAVGNCLSHDWECY